jgi:hypothetical protein
MARELYLLDTHLALRTNLGFTVPLNYDSLGESSLVKACDKHIIQTIEITEEMIELANRGDENREDTGCGILYGVLRDSAYKLRRLAVKEKEAHIRKGKWLQD